MISMAIFSVIWSLFGCWIMYTFYGFSKFYKGKQHPPEEKPHAWRRYVLARGKKSIQKTKTKSNDDSTTKT